jgi:hypothetical protein
MNLSECSPIEMILQRHVLLDARTLSLKGILLTPSTLIDRATGRFEIIPLRFTAWIGGAKDGIRVSDAWGDQRIAKLRKPMVGT